MKYCIHCGKELADEIEICTACGKNANRVLSPEKSAVLEKISERYKINGYIWIVVASIQILIGLLGSWTTLIIGGLNLYSAITDINYSKSVIGNPDGVVEKVKPLTGPIITLAYNIILGGVIGVAGSLYYLFGVRDFILKNEQVLST